MGDLSPIHFYIVFAYLLIMTTINSSCAQLLNIALSNIANIQSITVDIDDDTKITVGPAGLDIVIHDVEFHMDNPIPFLLRDRFIIEDEFKHVNVIFWILDE